MSANILTISLQCCLYDNPKDEMHLYINIYIYAISSSAPISFPIDQPRTVIWKEILFLYYLYSPLLLVSGKCFIFSIFNTWPRRKNMHKIQISILNILILQLFEIYLTVLLFFLIHSFCESFAFGFIDSVLSKKGNQIWY